MADSLGCHRKKLVLLDYRFWGILASHEGTRRRVHHFSSTSAFLPIYLMDEASGSSVSATYSLRRSHSERIPNHARNSRPVYSPNAQPPQSYRHGVGAGATSPECGRTEDARTTLYSLENGFQGVAERSGTPNRKPFKAKRLKVVTRTPSCSSGLPSTKINASEMRTQLLSIS